MSPCSPRQGIVEAADADAIARGLAQVRGEIEAGTFSFSRALEDIHMNVESRLAEIIGPAAGRLHTARSRNDQVAIDFRLWVRDAIDALARADRRRCSGRSPTARSKAPPRSCRASPICSRRSRSPSAIISSPMSRCWRATAGASRTRASASTNVRSAPRALAGTSFPIDREMTAKALGFDRPTANSLDSVADRDFALETLAAAAIAATHLSRFAEEIVLWTTPQFGFVRLSDAFTTGSSIMPQKRNPDAAELVRGKTGRIIGALVGLLTVMKGLPLAYSKDMQEDKEGVFDALQTLVALPRRDDRHGRAT